MSQVATVGGTLEAPARSEAAPDIAELSSIASAVGQGFGPCQ
jgi:hypothetical protein